MNQLNKKKKAMSGTKAEVIIAVAFTLLMFVLSWSEVVYIPISEHRVLDLSLVPVVFAAMIGGYKIAIPIGIGWTVLNFGSMNETFGSYSWQWVLVIKMTFSLSLVYFYELFKRACKFSPWNVYRTIVAALITKNIVDGIATSSMFPNIPSHLWMRDNFLIFIIELAICTLAMSLLIEKLRQIHILNGVKRKEKIQRENRSHAHHQHSESTTQKAN